MNSDKWKCYYQTMANLICDLHFWSLKEDLAVRDTDFSCFKYHDKSQQRAILDKPYAQVFIWLFIKYILKWKTVTRLHFTTISFNSRQNLVSLSLICLI